jgi:signal recognition particle receptor subunit beta
MLDENEQSILMALLSYAKREITYKIVYYGTGLGGKTTNLKYIYGQLAAETRGEMISLATETERTLYFDFLPVDLGTIQGFRARMSLYTVPGQEEYNESRKVILRGADGIVFVADSNPLKAAENAASLQNMIENLAFYQLSLNNMPWVLQYNKRDLSNAMPFDRMEKDLNVYGVPAFEAIALEGVRVFSTLKAITKMILNTTQSN